MKNKDVPIIIPSYEPDELLLDLCDRLTEADLTNVIVVDDGSGSSYQDIFEKIKAEYGFTVLIHKVNQGKGRALKTAFFHILEHQKEAIGCVTADSDGCSTFATGYRTVHRNASEAAAGVDSWLSGFFW